MTGNTGKKNAESWFRSGLIDVALSRDLSGSLDFCKALLSNYSPHPSSAFPCMETVS